MRAPSLAVAVLPRRAEQLIQHDIDWLFASHIGSLVLAALDEIICYQPPM